ncbi:MAG: NAD(P)-dependent oxidoreductase [Gemmatimonadales bacterium]|nr:NAD(P)-dependent oxidoreductase [Gemmatimonadales bacterium]MBA3553695.1 NAD(P)-dependent oxidoreductase [Gemmatimonadales bacterium]
MKIFVAGATGVIGRRAVPLLLQAGHQVTAAGRDQAKLGALGRLGARAQAIDLFDPAMVHRAVEGADVVVNLATAVPPPGPGMFLAWSWHPMDRVRRLVSRNLVQAALAGGTVQRLVQESFAPIYAAAGDAWVSETSPVRPARYNRSVLDAEAQAESFTRTGRTGVVLRFGLFYGPGDQATAALLAAVRRGWFPLFGRPEAYASWIAHEDAAGAVVAALDVPAGIYNVVEDEPLSRRELADGLARLLGAGPPRFLPAWATPLGGAVGGTLARSLRISNRKLKQASGWVPRYRTGVEGMGAVI